MEHCGHISLALILRVDCYWGFFKILTPSLYFIESIREYRHFNFLIVATQQNFSLHLI